MNTSPGIIGSGNWIVDTTKTVDVYPAQDSLANIESEQQNNGGGAFNLLVDLAKLGAGFPLQGLGMIGRDSKGDWILERLRSLGIGSEWLQRHDSAPTSYTDVMTVRSTGRRTFFHQRGANRHLGADHFPWELMNGRIFYLGYLMLLDGLDARDPEYGTIAARVLKNAGERGLFRVVDLVSVEHPDYGNEILPSLTHTDMLICNELEASIATGIVARDSHERYIPSAISDAGKALLDRGVREWVIIHLPEGAFALSKEGRQVWQGRVNLPSSEIVGAAGAGDAFAAGLLFGFHEGLDMQECLLQGCCTAAACLRHPTTSEGVETLEWCLNYGKNFGFAPFPEAA